MTIKWDIEREWDGLTVLIIGAGPDVTGDMIDAVVRDKTVAVNRAIRYAPNADMFVALDPHHPFWEAAESFPGIKVCGIETDDYPDARYAGMFYENVALGDNHTVSLRNNALAAIRIVECMGAKRIVLLGFDPERYEEVHAHTGFYGLTEGLKQMIVELRGKGIEIERIDSPVQHPGKPRERRGDALPAPVEHINPTTFPVRKRKT